MSHSIYAKGAISGFALISTTPSTDSQQNSPGDLNASAITAKLRKTNDEYRKHLAENDKFNAKAVHSLELSPSHPALQIFEQTVQPAPSGLHVTDYIKC
ncbi:MAG: hypothetical protein JSS60_04280 [Verrucomicrobia bacterium]|nr:hypothetical protein [Verrucomicrobiota bacterium]